MSNSAFKKMMLLSQEEMDRMKAKIIKEYDPSLNALAKLKDQIDALLMESKLPPDQQLKLLQTLENRFTTIKNAGAPGIVLAGISNQLPEPPQELPPAPEMPPLRLYGIGKRHIQHAEDLRDLISAHPDKLSYNDRMELVVDGNAIPGSNIHDLLSDAMTTSKTRSRPIGYLEFLQGLQNLNAPKSLLINPAYHSPIPESFSLASTPKRARHDSSRRKSVGPHFVTGKHKQPARKHILSLYDV